MNRNPYGMLEGLPKFIFFSDDIVDGQQLPTAQLSVRLGGQDVSPHLAWSGFPKQTRSFAVTVYDPDAPTPSGFWHWAVFNIPKDTTEFAQGIGSVAGMLPTGSVVLKNDRNLAAFIGAAPPSGTGRHRYIFVIYALDVEKLELSSETTPAFLTFNVLSHTLAWASITTWYEQV